MLRPYPPRCAPLFVSLLAGLIAGCSDSSTSERDRPVAQEITLTEAFTADFDLVDMHGEPASDERFEGKPMLIYFGFTHCPDVCPLALGILSAALDEMGDAAGGIHPLYITVDPERDTQERLAQYLAFDDRILGLTGAPEALEKARGGMRVFAKRVDLPESAAKYSVDHQSLFFLTDEKGIPVRAFEDTIDPQVLARRIKAWM